MLAQNAADVVPTWRFHPDLRSIPLSASSTTSCASRTTSEYASSSRSTGRIFSRLEALKR